MQDNRPLILISNDDGYQAGGINQLIDILKSLANLVVVAPDSSRSGAGMSITSSDPVRIQRIVEQDNVVVYACSGTPVDCVKLAVHGIVPRKPDLVVSGINHGDNSGMNVHYSGTMGAVIEGCLKGIPSIGFSSCNIEKDADFSSYSTLIQDIVKKVLANGLPDGTCLNVNFPLIPDYKGVRITRQDEGQWFSEWEEMTRKSGAKHYWLSGYYQSNNADDTSTDRWAIDQGFVAITPTKIDMTDYDFMGSLADWFEL